MRIEISDEYKELLLKELAFISENTSFLTQDEFIQHGNTSVLYHCICVAFASCRIADKLGADIDRSALIRGALLHDYFLYDWHVADASHRLHGFRHPKKALANAMRDLELNDIEKNIIIRHMFPLTLVPPTCYEAWIVCMADKFCSTMETLHMSIECNYAGRA